MSDEKLDLNKATAADLQKLPGIGKALAARIVKHRREIGSFSAVGDLADVSGVSEQMVQDLSQHLTVSTAEAVSALEAKEGEEPPKEVTIEEMVSKKSPDAAGRSTENNKQVQELRAAARVGDLRRVQTLIKAGADGNDRFALIWSAEKGFSQVVTELIREGADVNSKTARGGTTALALASQNGHLDVVDSLIKAGADVDEPVIEGWTPLMKAAFFGHNEIVRALLAAGAKVRTRDGRGKSAIDYAKQSGNDQIAVLLSR